jgi:uncharacterized protein YndB with AHSA1/START domain
MSTLRMSRRFDASPEQVFDAWLDPKVAGRWLFTSPTSQAHTTELDARVGGAWVITDRRDGVDYRALGEYLEIDRPRRLVFSFGMPQFAEGFARVTVEIAADGTGALMTLTQEEVPAGAEAGLEEGWGAMFEAMAGLL